MSYFRAEIFRLTRSAFVRNVIIYTFAAGLVVFLFRYYSPALNFYREPNGFGLLAYTSRAVIFIWQLFLIFFLNSQFQLENNEGIIRQILTTPLKRRQFAWQRWLISGLSWSAGFAVIYILFVILAGLFVGYPAIAEQQYIFYTKWQMIGATFLLLVLTVVSLVVMTGVINLMFLYMGNLGILPAIILLLALFFVPDYNMVETFFPGIHLSLLPLVLEKMANKLPVDFTDFAIRYMINQIIWITIVFFLQVKAISHRDFSK